MAGFSNGTRSCQVTHVVLAAGALPHRSYGLDVIGAAVLGAARGQGHSSPTAAASKPSITTPTAPICLSKPTLAFLVVVAVTWWSLATSCGTSRCPRTPLPPATNTRMIVCLASIEIPLPESRQDDLAVCDTGAGSRRHLRSLMSPDVTHRGTVLSPVQQPNPDPGEVPWIFS
jgi:hypothetical protein